MSIEGKKIDDVPTDIMQIIQDLDITERKYKDEIYTNNKIFEINDLEKELKRIKELHSDLKRYSLDCAHLNAEYSSKVQHILRKIVEEIPGIQYMEAYRNIFTQDERYRIAAILKEKRRTEMRDWRRPETADEDAEIRLKEWQEKLMIYRNKAVETNNLYITSDDVLPRLQSLIRTLKFAVVQCRNRMALREIRELEEREKEEKERPLMKEKFQCLCEVMKEVLGHRVENVVVSFEFSAPCTLTDWGMDGKKTMEINPKDYVIQDLKNRSEANKNDFHVRNATLLLFNFADLYWMTRQQTV